MGYTAFRNGLEVQTSSAIDKRLLLSKAEMLTAEDDYMLPDQYFCLCKDDGKFYLYNVNNVPNNLTGKYKLLDDTFKYTTAEARENLDKAVAENITIGSETTKAAVQGVIDDTITQLKIDGQIVE